MSGKPVGRTEPKKRVCIICESCEHLSTREYLAVPTDLKSPRSVPEKVIQLADNKSSIHIKPLKSTSCKLL